MEGKPLGKTTGEEAVHNRGITVDRHVFPGDKYVVEYDAQVGLVKPAGERIVKGGADLFGQMFVGIPPHEGEAGSSEGHEESDRKVLFALNQPSRLDILTHISDMAEGSPGGDHARPTHDNAIVALFNDVHIDIALLGRWF